MIKTVVSSALPVDEKLIIRKNVIHNGDGKKRMCVVTGTHGDELEGQYVCFELIRRLEHDFDYLNGTVEIYPSLNPLGSDSWSRGVSHLNQELNLKFPGSPGGSMAETISYSICEDLKGADIVIDIQSSNIFLSEVPRISINVDNTDTLLPYARKMNVKLIRIDQAANSPQATLSNSLNDHDTPTLVVEMGEGMKINLDMGNKLVTGIFNLMHDIGIWKGYVEKDKICEPVVSDDDKICNINANAAGFFITELRNDAIVEENQLIGQIVDPLTGKVMQEIHAPAKGEFFTIRTYPMVYPGSLIARMTRL